MLVAGLLLVSLPPECPFFTRAEAEMALGGAVQSAEVAPPNAMMPGTTITNCTFTGSSRSIAVSLTSAKSPAMLQSFAAKQRADDAAAKKKELADSLERAKAEEQSPELRGDPDAKPTPEEVENYFPRRIQEYEAIGGVQARFYAEPHNGSVEYGVVKGARGLSALLMWRGKPSETTAHRAKLKAAFASAVQRL